MAITLAVLGEDGAEKLFVSGRRFLFLVFVRDGLFFEGDFLLLVRGLGLGLGSALGFKSGLFRFRVRVRVRVQVRFV